MLRPGRRDVMNPRATLNVAATVQRRTTSRSRRLTVIKSVSPLRTGQAFMPVHACTAQDCGNNVYSGDYALPEGQLIVRGGAVIIPPIGTRQRQFPDVLGTHRLNLGDGYALHGTQAVSQLGRNVSHGCVRLHNDDIARLYALASEGDEVIIY